MAPHHPPKVSEPAWLVYLEHRGRQEVADCCARAARCGVRLGMTVSQATSLVRGPIHLEPADAVGDQATLSALARWCVRFSPRVAVDEAGHALILDMTGCDRLYGNPHRMTRTVADRLATQRWTLRLALAPTRAGALALARFGDAPLTVVLHLDELQTRLDALPIAALSLAPAEHQGLDEVGIERIEQLRSLPREQIASRFDGDLLRRLDRALGDEACVPIEPVRPWEPPQVERRFAGPTTHSEAIEHAAQQLAESLSRLLHQQGRATSTLQLQVERLDETLRTQHAAQTLTLSRPSRDPRHLWAMLRPHVERMHRGQGVEALRLIARQAPRVFPSQTAAAEWTPAQAQAHAQREAHRAALIDRFTARLGPPRVRRPTLRATHVPEAAVCWVPAIEPTTRDHAQGITAWADAPRSVSDPAWHDLEQPNRPTWLFERPEPAEVILMHPEGPVLQLRWRNTLRTLIHSVGPERIGPRWWRSIAGPDHVNANDDAEAQHAFRDYYRVQDNAGRWLWIFRRSDRPMRAGRWFVHGVWA